MVVAGIDHLGEVFFLAPANALLKHQDSGLVAEVQPSLILGIVATADEVGPEGLKILRVFD